jgi:hypothetical protein
MSDADENALPNTALIGGVGSSADQIVKKGLRLNKIFLNLSAVGQDEVLSFAADVERKAKMRAAPPCD